MVPPHRAPFRGRLRGRLRGRENGTRTAGGCPKNSRGGCPIPPRLRGGRSRLYVSLQEGSPARTRAGRRAETSGAMPDRRIRAFLVVGGVSVASAWTWPGAFPATDPVAVLVRYQTPNVYRAVVAWYDVASGVAVFLPGQFLISTSRDLVRSDGRPCGAPAPPSDVAAFAYGRRAGHRRRRCPSPGPSHREPGARMADDPGAGPLYRRGDFRRGRVRQDVGVYAPVRAPASSAGKRTILSGAPPRSSLK